MNQKHVERDEYHALDWRGDSGFSVEQLWNRFPELVVGRYLVNTSFDSGSLTLSESDRELGWHLVGRLTHSPQIRCPGEIPHDQFDEWLVFERRTRVEQFETLANYGGFTPVEFGWEEKRERFWEQIVRFHPLHVIAENDGVYLVSRDGEMINRILGGEPDAPPSGRSADLIPTSRRSQAPDSLRTPSSGVGG